MVHIIEGNSVIGAHVLRDIGNYVCFKRLYISTACSKELCFELPSNTSTMNGAKDLGKTKNKVKISFGIQE